MFQPVKVVDVELSRSLHDLEGLGDYAAVKALLRVHGRPVGCVQIPVQGGVCRATDLIRAALDRHGWPIVLQLLRSKLTQVPLKSGGLVVGDLLNSSAPVYGGPRPVVTIAVCTRGRPRQLKFCLDGLMNLTYPCVDLLVVDNAPEDDATEKLVRKHYPAVRYVREPRPGLDWARNRAILEAQGEIIAFTDDDVVVDPGWVTALVAVFAEDPEVMAVTGLVVPDELETEAQHLFERAGGFGRGYVRKWFHVGCGLGQYFHLGAGIFGTGANMAFRRELFDQIGGFDQALDVGTATQGGGDLEMFFRVVQEGHVLVYEPEAVVRHRHRRQYAELKAQLFHNGLGLYAYFLRSALFYPTQRLAFLRFGLWWLWRGHIRRLLLSFLRPVHLPRDLTLAELWGCLLAPVRYHKSRRAAARIAEMFGQQQVAVPPVARPPADTPSRETAIRTVDLGQPLRHLPALQDYRQTRVFVTLEGELLGMVDIPNFGLSISPARLCQAIVDRLSLRLLDPGSGLRDDAVYSNTLAALAQHYLPQADGPAELSPEFSVSIVIATLDRPDNLRACLHCLAAQQSSRRVEIVIVDNSPASGMTPLVLAEFPGVVLVNEPRRGLAYARNAGFVAATGDIIVATDDDVLMSPTWLEKLVAPFARSDVMAVTGNVLPLELDTTAQQLFEAYGGLGRGFQRIEADRHWFEKYKRRAVPTWELGATANAAFRATVFSDPSIGLMDEALGPGMPSGVGEDTYLFYRILKAGHTLIYEPAAYVWHKHRRELGAFRKQLFDYSKGHVAYHLTTLLRDRDLRVLPYLMFPLPAWHMGRFWRRLRGRSVYPCSLIFLEILGNLAGPLALLRSRWRVRRCGRSSPFVPVWHRPGNPLGTPGAWSPAAVSGKPEGTDDRADPLPIHAAGEQRPW